MNSKLKLTGLLFLILQTFTLELCAAAQNHGIQDLSGEMFLAVESGFWNDQSTWGEAGIPTKGASVTIPEGLSVKIRSIIDKDFERINVKGSLVFNGESDSFLSCRTLVVEKTGSLTIGSKDVPIRSDNSVEIEFLGTHKTQISEAEIGGGLVAMGKVEMYGAAKAAYSVPTIELTAGRSVLNFSESPNWSVGDQLVFPATEFDGEDEVRSIKTISNGGLSLELDRPLIFDHKLPKILKKSVPVGNLSRNIRISTRSGVPISERAHVIFMERQSGTVIDGVSFNRMGRTDAKMTHTLPASKNEASNSPESLSNSIGRYSVHFHVRSRADINKPPHVVKNSVVENCAKHGVVNHGGHVEASYNVTFGCVGSHFFAENGSEVGSFSNNLAIRSEGSGEHFLAREANSDFGHGGHGFWLQGGGGVLVTDNYAFGHSESAYFYFGQYMIEDNQVVYYDRKNLRDPSLFEDVENIFPRDIPIYFDNNLAASSKNGLDIWNNKEYAEHSADSLVLNSEFYSNHNNAIFIPYSKNLLLSNIVALGDKSFQGIGINTNTKTSGLKIQNSIIKNYLVGMDLPRHGTTDIDGITMSNIINFRIWSPLSRDRRIVLNNVDFQDFRSWTDFWEQDFSKKLEYFSKSKKKQYDFYMEGVKPTERGDLSMVFEPTAVIVESGNNDYVGKQIYFPEQAGDFVPFPNTEVPELQNKSNELLWGEYKLAVGGALLPSSAESHPKIKGYIAPLAEYLPRVPDYYFVVKPTVYKGNYLKDFSYDEYKEGWNFLPVSMNGESRTVMLYADNTPPFLEMDPAVSLKIHPDDVRYGFRLKGDVIDYVAGLKTVNRVNREYKNLVKNEHGFIDLEYPITDAAGNVNVLKYQLEITDEVPRRGQDISKYAGATSNLY